MSRLIITGGTKICGEIQISGAKNAILPILACTLLSDKPVILENCPRITDVFNMLGILETLGCSCEFIGDTLYIDTRDADNYKMPQHLSREIRSSIFMLGPILGRFKKAECVYPGGCEIGNRPIDLHLNGLAKLNVAVSENNGVIYCDGENLTCADIHLDYPSVGATENIMMAAAKANGRTHITNAAREPEIEDLQMFLRKIGVNVYGAGTSTITIDGLLNVDGEVVEHRIMPDRIVAGTVLCAAAITGGSVYIRDVCPGHMLPVLSKLTEAGCDIEIEENALSLRALERPHEIQHIETLPHPGFPTDMQPQILALCSIADGTSVIIENVFENRFRHLPEIKRMGASVVQKDRMVIIRGVKHLNGAIVSANDLRGGAALTIAGLAARGRTVVENVEYIDRGYESIENMLNSLGACIVREDDTQ